MHDGNGLIGNLMPFHNNSRNEPGRGYHCYIRLLNNVLLHAVLRPYPNHAVNIPTRSTHVYVRLPGQPHIIYSGALEPLHGSRPSWLPQ